MLRREHGELTDMTKKHFEAAAAYVRAFRTGTPDARRNCADVADSIERAFIAVFREFNPRFDVDRFRAACRGADATDSAGRTVKYGTALACGRGDD